MNQSRRVTPIALALAAILILGGSIAAAAVLPKVVAPSGAAQASPGAKDKPSAEKVQAILDRLGAAGITTTADDFNALGDKYGVGGAVRVLAFAHAAGKSTSDITAMVDAGKGWGRTRFAAAPTRTTIPKAQRPTTTPQTTSRFAGSR